MNTEDILFVAKIVEERSGIVLTEDKSYLLESRLSPIARKEGFASIEELVAAMRSRNDERINWAVTEAMTINETYFFRDKAPFDLVQKVILPNKKADGHSGAVRILCVGASTGQEAYSLAMLIHEAAHMYPEMTFEIVATDLSDRAVEKAKSGFYSQFEIQRGLPVKSLVKYFDKQDDMWRLKSTIRDRVTFQQHNVLNGFDGFGAFDLVFCRNVISAFDATNKEKVMDHLADVISPNGYLILGAAETTAGISNDFQVKGGHRHLYERKGTKSSGQVAA